MEGSDPHNDTGTIPEFHHGQRRRGSKCWEPVSPIVHEQPAGDVRLGEHGQSCAAIRPRPSVAAHRMEVFSSASPADQAELSHIKTFRSTRRRSSGGTIAESQEDIAVSQDDDVSQTSDNTNSATSLQYKGRKHCFDSFQLSVGKLRQKTVATSGWLTDYLIRMRASAQLPAQIEMLDAMLGPKELAALKLGDVSGASLGFSFEECVSMKSQEMTTDSIRRDLTIFWNYHNGVEETRSKGANTMAMFQGCFSKIAMFQRQSVCLRDEVSNWLLRKKLLNEARNKEQVQVEPQEERWDRLQKFWSHVHSDDRKVDDLLKAVPATASGGLLKHISSLPKEVKDMKLPAAPELLPPTTNSRPGSRADRSEALDWPPLEVPGSTAATSAIHAARANLASRGSSTSCVSRPTSRSFRRPSLTPISGTRHASATPSLPNLLRKASAKSQGSAIPGQRPDSKCWKTRASRSHCTQHRGNPDFPPSPLSPEALTFSSRTGSRHGGTSSRLSWSHWEDEAELFTYREANPPKIDPEKIIGKWYTKGLELPSHIKPKHIPMPKSNSLPSLKSLGRRDFSSAGSIDGDISDSASTLLFSEAWNTEDLYESKPVMTEPWITANPNLKFISAPPKQYLRSCQSNTIVPKPLPFMTGDSKRLQASGKGLLDSDLMSITDVARDSLLQDIDLSGNTLLTEKSLLPFVDALCGMPLRSLTFNRLVNAGQAVLEAIILLLGNPNSGMGVTRLQSLDLSSISLAPRWQFALCKVVMDHPNLQKLNLADTGLGDNPGASDCIGMLWKSSTLQSLNIGWNSFQKDVLINLGAGLVTNQTLRSLNLANCFSSTVPNDVGPVLHLVEHLSRDRTLTQLDVSLNRIDYRGALIIEDALMKHSRLNDLNISQNPLGVLGIRSMLRLIASDESGLTNFRIDNCSTGRCPPNDDKHPIFNATNPGSRYSLDLEQPYCRALLRMLYKTCERFAVPPEQAFRDINSRGFQGPYSHPQKDEEGIWVIPSKGKLTVTFTIERAFGGVLKGLKDNDFVGFLDMHSNLMRFRAGFKKVVPMFAQWSKLSGCKQDRQVMIEALSKDFQLTYAQMKNLCWASRESSPETILKLLPCVLGGEGVRYLCASMMPSLGGFIRMMKKSRNFFNFNPENPTGHYRLELEQASDYYVAESILLLDRFEAGITLKNDRVDVSQRGNRSQIRNELYQGRPLAVASLAEWTLATSDTLDFDYASNRRAPADACVLDEVTLGNIIIVLQQAEIESDLMMDCLRNVSHMVFLKCVQIRELLAMFSQREIRQQIIVMFFNRVVDLWNEKLFRVQFKDPAEFQSLCEALGYLACFPFMQPELIRLECNFKNHDERLAINALVLLATKESLRNVTDFQLTLENGTVDPLPQGLPRSWEQADRIPKSGVFKARYNCSPDDRKFSERKRLVEIFGFISVPVQESEVLWWADINQTPDDVLELLTFICRRFKSVKHCFKFIDGEDGNGVISLREFEEGVKEMGFKKFRDRPKKMKSSAKLGLKPGTPDVQPSGRLTEKERILHVFRYLDPSGEGGVSVDEFFVLELLWNEVNLCIHEFVQFLDRTIGDDLDEAWEFFDEDGSGEIDKEEWQQICQKLMYFGPVMPIFRFLDEDGEGSISADEFCQLESFQHEDHLQEDEDEDEDNSSK